MWNLNNFKYIKTMKNFSLFKSLLIMLCMVLMGGGSVKAETKTVTYTVASKTSVTTTGDAPIGSAATFNNNGSNDNDQLTGGKQMTLTLSGYDGMTITGITLSMKSNKKAGAGYLDIKAGETSLATIGSSSGVAFNDVLWNGSFSQTYVDKVVSLSNSSYVIQSDEKVVVIIGATANSLYCQSFTFTYEEPAVDPNKPEAPNFSLGAGTYYIKTGDSKQVELKTDVVDGEIYYTTNGDDPTTAGIKYTSALTLTSTTTVKACVKKGEYYSNVVSNTYTILPSIANTKETAYTTADAIEKIKATSQAQLEAEKVYVTGVVSKVDDINDGAITYWLDDNKFEVYKGKNIDNVAFNATSDVAIKAEVIVYGNLKKFGNTYELGEGNYLVSYKASTATLQSVTIERGPSVKTNYLEGESFDKTGLVAYANYDDGSKLDVTSSAEWTITPPSALSVGTTQVSVYASYGAKQSETSQIDISVSPTTTIDLSTTSQVTTANADKLEWTAKESEVPVFVVTVDKDGSLTNANNCYPGTPEENYDHTRFYKDSKLTFTPSATVRLEKIVFTSTSTSYANALAISTWTNATASVSGSIVTIVPKNGMLPVSAVIGGATRGTGIVVGYTVLTEVNSRTTATGSYGTVCLPRDAKVVGAKIYDVTDANVNTVSITEVNGDVLKAGKPYVYKATADNQSFYCASDDDLKKDAGTNGVLVGSYTEENVTANAGNYILSGDVFHLVNSDNVKVGANRAYIHIGSPSGARLLIAEGDTETGICLPMVDAEEKDASTGVYDLSGRRVVNAKSGVYVQNGKLVIK